MDDDAARSGNEPRPGRFPTGDMLRLVEGSPDAIVVHADGVLVYANAAAARLAQVADPESLLGRPVGAFVPRELQVSIGKHIEEVLERGGPGEPLEERVTRPDGQVMDIEVVVVPARWNEEPAAQVIVRDITVRKTAERQLVHDAFHDSLTGLPNRALLLERLEMLVNRASRRDEELAFGLLFMDLDRFKDVNDSLGHLVGDELLVSVARRLQRCVRPTDTVARFAGDEFAILLHELDTVGDALHVADRVLAEVSRPHRLTGHQVGTTASVGIALSATGYEKAEDVLRDADLAMYRAKAQGRARREVFDRAMLEQALALLQLERELAQGLDRKEFELVYQPIMALADGSVAGLEALLRWRHPERGVLLPSAFLRVAEDSGLLVHIGVWVLEEAAGFRAGRGAAEGEDGGPFVAVNLSMSQLLQPDLEARVMAVLGRTGCPPRGLVLEVPEAVYGRDGRPAWPALSGLAGRGVRLCVGDLGTGSTSLEALHQLPPAQVKVDAHLIAGLDSEKGRGVALSVMELAARLGADIVAEAVETEPQLEWVRARGATHAQGWLFHPALPAPDAQELLRTGGRGDARRPLVPESS
ncbi:MAG TPA: bifunctional diguanylate cyclase/phosphodiesterase [Longimicrobiales bacterium]|nr:bifunctional diguanylate cyclase/phosphodiesterase [Longimicrobiales bacterium]